MHRWALAGAFAGTAIVAGVLGALVSPGRLSGTATTVAEACSRYCIVTGEAVLVGDEVTVKQPQILLLDTTSGRAWTYSGGLLLGEHISIWSPIEMRPGVRKTSTPSR